MQTFRLTPRVCRAACAPSSRTTFVTRFPSSDIAPLFSLLDGTASSWRHQRSFSPRFDVRETAPAYELQGELPGIRQEDVSIEFVDGTTLVVKGHFERNTDVSAPAEEKPSRDESSPATVVGSEKSTYRKATVEDDEYVDAGAESQAEIEIETKEKVTSATTDADASGGKNDAEEKTREARQKYWISERRTGQFERRFKFVGQLDQDAVKASLKDGVLSIVVPKVEKKERRILVE